MTAGFSHDIKHFSLLKTLTFSLLKKTLTFSLFKTLTFSLFETLTFSLFKTLTFRTLTFSLTCSTLGIFVCYIPYLTCLLLNLSHELELHLLQCGGQPVQLVTVVLHPVVESLHLHPHRSLPVLQLLLPHILSEVDRSFSHLKEAVINGTLRQAYTFTEKLCNDV